MAIFLNFPENFKKKIHEKNTVFSEIWVRKTLKTGRKIWPKNLKIFRISGFFTEISGGGKIGLLRGKFPPKKRPKIGRKNFLRKFFFLNFFFRKFSFFKFRSLK
jgi:hypothetical protein